MSISLIMALVIANFPRDIMGFNPFPLEAVATKSICDVTTLFKKSL